jgi:hypothetical protein
MADPHPRYQRPWATHLASVSLTCAASSPRVPRETEKALLFGVPGDDEQQCVRPV